VDLSGKSKKIFEQKFFKNSGLKQLQQSITLGKKLNSSLVYL